MRTFERARIFLRLRFKRRTCRGRARVRTLVRQAGHEDRDEAKRERETHALLAPLVTHTACEEEKEGEDRSAHVADERRGLRVGEVCGAGRGGAGGSLPCGLGRVLEGAGEGWIARVGEAVEQKTDSAKLTMCVREREERARRRTAFGLAARARFGLATRVRPRLFDNGSFALTRYRCCSYEESTRSYTARRR